MKKPSVTIKATKEEQEEAAAIVAALRASGAPVTLSWLLHTATSPLLAEPQATLEGKPGMARVRGPLTPAQVAQLTLNEAFMSRCHSLVETGEFIVMVALRPEGCYVIAWLSSDGSLEFSAAEREREAAASERRKTKAGSRDYRLNFSVTAREKRALQNRARRLDLKRRRGAGDARLARITVMAFLKDLRLALALKKSNPEPPHA